MWNGVARVEKRFHFNNFLQALACTNKVGELAKKLHHPGPVNRWGKVTVSLVEPSWAVCTE